MTTPTDDESAGAEKVRMVMRDMLNAGRPAAPPVISAVRGIAMPALIWL